MQSLDRHVIEATLMASSARYVDLDHDVLRGVCCVGRVQDVGHFPKESVVLSHLLLWSRSQYVGNGVAGKEVGCMALDAPCSVGDTLILSRRVRMEPG